MKITILLRTYLLIVLFPVIIFASPADELKAASENGTVAFLIVTEPGATKIELARQTVREAMNSINSKSVMVELDRSDKANSQLVAQYRLSGAPVPLVLVFAQNGVIAGGLPIDKASPQKLAQMIPSPKKAEVLKALRSKQSVFITVSRASMDPSDEINSTCAMACSKMQGKAQTIQIDMDDESELQFLKELKISQESTKPVTIVLNSQGQITSKLIGAVEVGSLVQAASKKAGGCCPPGSGKTCDPPKKKK